MAKAVVINGLLLLSSSASATYMVTCHDEHECGTVCGKYSSDMVAPSEGLFGTSCSCQSSGLTEKCTAFGKKISECSDGRAPNCKTSCGQKICMSNNGKKKTATILSACPKHHPQNVKQCCDHSSSKDWCTCNVQNTLDSIKEVYKALGGKNSYVDATWGQCGSALESLNIGINSTRANELVQPFLVTGELCKGVEEDYLKIKANQPEILEMNNCEELDAESCERISHCMFCQSRYDPIPTKCYDKQEASVLKHILGVEQGSDSFTCL
jgi:hypothetical protein